MSISLKCLDHLSSYLVPSGFSACCCVLQLLLLGSYVAFIFRLECYSELVHFFTSVFCSVSSVIVPICKPLCLKAAINKIIINYSVAHVTHCAS